MHGRWFISFGQQERAV